MTGMKKVDPGDIKSQKTICEVLLHGEAPSQRFRGCEILSSEKSECVVIKISETNSEIKIKKTVLLNLMGYNHDFKKYTERI